MGLELEYLFIYLLNYVQMGGGVFMLYYFTLNWAGESESRIPSQAAPNTRPSPTWGHAISLGSVRTPPQ
jgi:hypothetical protein